jgi:hypothetical protein
MQHTASQNRDYPSRLLHLHHDSTPARPHTHVNINQEKPCILRLASAMKALLVGQTVVVLLLAPFDFATERLSFGVMAFFRLTSSARVVSAGSSTVVTHLPIPPQVHFFQMLAPPTMICQREGAWKTFSYSKYGASNLHSWASRGRAGSLGDLHSGREGNIAGLAPELNLRITD